MIFVVSFFAYKFLDLAFDLFKSRVRKQGARKDSDVIETEFVSKTDDENKKDT